ncbi:apolipoprotein D-like [Artemia franciscana]
MVVKPLIWALSFCFSSVFCQVSFWGKCPDVSTKSDFNATQYLGDWFEYARYFAFFQQGQKCTKAQYTGISDGLIGVKNTATYRISNKATFIEGVATIKDSTQPAKLTVSFLIGGVILTSSPYWVLETDYTTFSVVWSCSNMPFFNKQILWILTRARNPSQSIVDVAYEAIDARGLNRDKLGFTDQTNCSL